MDHETKPDPIDELADEMARDVWPELLEKLDTADASIDALIRDLNRDTLAELVDALNRP